MTPNRTEIFHDPADIRETWLALERSGIHTPYQRFEFVAAWLRNVGQAEGATAAIAVMRDLAGEALAIFPFCTTSLGPLRLLRFVGGKHSNFNMGLFSSEAPAVLHADMLRETLRAAGIATGAHLAVLESQPRSWEGFANPLAALANHESAEPAYKMSLSGDFEALIADRVSKDARGKLRRKERRLSEFGAISYRRAQTAAEVNAGLDAFFSQKTARFLQLGQPDVFAEPGVRAFITEASLAGLEHGAAAIQLYLCVAGERIVATYGAAIDEKRFCGMFTSFDNAEDMFRWSPGDLLLFNLVRIMHEKGFSTFDLGVGEAKYKESYCDQIEPLFDTIMPLSAIGGPAALAYRCALAAKARIKQSPRLLAAINKLRSR